MLDLAAGINIVIGLAVVWLELRVYQSCPANPNRWVFIIKAAAGAALALIFAHALLFNSGVVDPAIGRPAVTLALMSLAMGAIVQYKRKGC